MATQVVTNKDGSVTVCIDGECVTVSCPEATSAGAWPEPAGVYLVAPAHEIDSALAELVPNEPLVLRQVANEPIDMHLLRRVVGRAERDGRDVVVIVDEQA